MMHNLIAGVIGDSYGRMGTWDQFWHCLQVGRILLLHNWADSFGFDVRDFPSVSAPTLAHIDSWLLGIIEYNFIPLPRDLITRTGGLKEVMRGINGGIKRLIILLTMKYYYHGFINSPKVHIPHTPPTFGKSSPTCTYCQENGQKKKKNSWRTYKKRHYGCRDNRFIYPVKSK